MINFQSLKYKNILSVGNSAITIRLDNQETNLIVGKNGVGKSTVIESLTYALYGKPFRNINKPNLINSINKNNLLVELEFATGGKQYLIKRGMKPNIFEIYQDGLLISQDADAYDYQNKLEQDILHMNYRAFTQIVVLGSATYIPFLSLKPGPRREIIEDLLHLQVFTSMNSVLKERMIESKERLRDLEKNIELAEDKIKFIRDHLSELLKDTSELIFTKQNNIVEKITKYNSVYEEYLELKANIVLLNDQYLKAATDIQEKREKALNLKHKINERKRLINKDLLFFQSASDCPTCSQGIPHEHKQKIVGKHSVSLQDLDSTFAKVNERLEKYTRELKNQEKLKNQLTDMQAKYHEAKTTCKHTLEAIKTLKADVKRLHQQHEKTSSDANQIDTIQDELNLHIKEREDIINESTYHRIAAMLLKDTGIKAQLIKQYIPVINQYINKYLSDLDFFVQFELNENFEEVIKSKYRDEFSYDNFSEGEKFRIDLSILLTLRAIAKIRNSCTSNLLFLDEIFDSSLDDGGVEDFLKILDVLVGEKQTIFVISHKSDILNDKFQNVIRFKKNGNFSQIVED